MSTPLDKTLRALNDCGCCEKMVSNVPVETHNRPGLAAVQYRVGTHASFKERMIARLASSDYPQLKFLKVRDDDDFTIALLDAWATSLDVLSFYQERIANEAFLRTATEQRSVYYQANLIGYKPRPGVAASAHVAFEMETADGAPIKTEIAAGTKIQSIPGPGEKPQVFETIEAIEGRPEWNALRPRLTQPQIVDASMEQALLQGVGKGLKNGDVVLVVADESGAAWSLNRITRVTVEKDRDATLIDFVETVSTPLPFFFQPALVQAFIATPLTFSSGQVSSTVINATWNQSDLQAFTAVQGWSLSALAVNISAQLAAPALPGKSGIFSIARQTAVFGHNAPKWSALPVGQRYGEWTNSDPGNSATKVFRPAAYPNNWDINVPTLSTESQNNKYLHLDAVYENLVVGAWVVLRNQSGTRLYQIRDIVEVTRSDYAISAKVTRLTLDSDDDLNLFNIRNATVYIANALPMALAELPIQDTLPPSIKSGDDVYVPEGDVSNIVLLDHFDLNLKAGQTIVLGGEDRNLDGVTTSEVLTIDEALLSNGYTQLVLKSGLQHVYKRDTVTINANVAPATHGETKTEVLGNGDGMIPFQKFFLKQPPLTYIPAQTSSGARTALEIRVNGVQWQETDNFRGHGARDQVYIVRTSSDGETWVQFGDGINGARLPTGTQNVTAVYRQGMGMEGLVGERQLSLLMTKPLGVKGVSNPVEAAGAQDREPRDQARENAPLTVLTLERIVSLQDYEDFARAFAGVSKALATWTWDGHTRGVFITVAGPDGAAVLDSSATYENLITAIRQSGDPFVPVWVKSYRPAYFVVEGTVRINELYQADDVLKQVKQKLRDSFSFEPRQFGQAVAKSEVMAVMQSVEGVTAVNITGLYRIDEKPALIAETPQPGADDPLAAELLLLDPRPVALEIMA